MIKRIKQLNHFCILGFLLFLGFLVYSNAIFHPFVHDDIAFIEKNPNIASLEFNSIFLRPSSPIDQNPLINAYYRPLLELFTRIQYKIFHFNPHGYHFVNILIHVLNSFMIYVLIKMIIDRVSILSSSLCSFYSSLAIALLFLVHPVQSEAVNCISGMSNLLLTFLCLISLFFFLLGEQSSLFEIQTAEKKKYLFSFHKGHFFYLASLCFFLMSLLTKEQAVLFPLVILLYQGTVGKYSDVNLRLVNMQMPFGTRSSLGARNMLPWQTLFCSGLKASGYFAILYMYMSWRHIILGASLLRKISFSSEFWLRILAIPRTFLMYLRIVIFPYDLHYYRSTDILAPFWIPFLVLICVLMLGLWAVIFAKKYYRCLLFFSFGWFLLFLLPVLNIVPLINEYSFILTSEHFLYLPFWGIALFFVLLVYNYFENKIKAKQMYAMLIFGLFIGFLSWITFRQNTFWRGEIPLFKRTLTFEKDFGRGRILLAKAYYGQGLYLQAIEENNKALKIIKNYLGKVASSPAKFYYLGLLKGIYFDLAHCYERREEFVSAIEAYQKAIGIDPQDGVLQNNLGVIYLRMNDWDKAMDHFRKALILNDQDLKAKQNLNYVYYQKSLTHETTQ